MPQSIMLGIQKRKLQKKKKKKLQIAKLHLMLTCVKQVLCRNILKVIRFERNVSLSLSDFFCFSSLHVLEERCHNTKI